MSGSFSVQTEGLQSAAVAVAASGVDVEQGHSALGAGAGALDGTPVAFPYADFLGAAEGALQSMHTAADGLSRALNAAAYAYQAADATVAQSLRPGG
jgi:hypothetical protein